MITLVMRAIGGTQQTISINVDTENVIASGGYGSIYNVPNDPTVVVKKLDMEPTLPLGDLNQYLAHISVTKDRMQRIIDEENINSNKRQFIIDSVKEILDYSLSTHFYCDHTNFKISAIWFLQKKAIGKRLTDHFVDEPMPSEDIRKRIARDVVTRMRTLRRADLVHLDCVEDNIMYESSQHKVTVIDLDGCGIINRPDPLKNNGVSSDQWSFRPLTIGKTKLMKLPPWYPQAGVESNPRRGYYLFAERWVILDTIINILTWRKMGILSWFNDVTMRKDIGNSYKEIAVLVNSFKQTNSDHDNIRSFWETTMTRKMGELSHKYAAQMAINPPKDYWQQRGFPDCLYNLSSLAQRAYLDPRALSSFGSMYDKYLAELR